MAHDDRSSDQFIREVDEELRRDQLRALWERFGALIIAVCVAIVLITAGYRGWLWWQARQAAESGDRYIAALRAAEAGSSDEAERIYSEIAQRGDGGYGFLARLALAGEKAKAGATEDAIAGFDAIAADGRVPAVMRDLARLRGALLALGAGDLQGAASRAEPLNQSGNPWRHMAREVVATVAYEDGDLGRARELFATIQQDAEAPQDGQTRATMMVALIDGQSSSGGTGPDAGAAEPSADPAPADGAPANATPTD
ncbi:tetratricopeptide repeat protein [Faunimonas sp. B44]|uniref:tetratricopeptide repeat protein n=1 Tax=Faunimonas sp. B44 TaxID=3461493 RepID=UPI0040439FF8